MYFREMLVSFVLYTVPSSRRVGTGTENEIRQKKQRKCSSYHLVSYSYFFTLILILIIVIIISDVHLSFCTRMMCVQVCAITAFGQMAILF